MTETASQSDPASSDPASSDPASSAPVPDPTASGVASPSPGRRGAERVAGRPLVVGLTGGTGVGKSTVTALLAAHGAVVVDCDQLGRDVVAPGGPALEPIFSHFGHGVGDPDGGLDRAALAAVVFNDAEALRALNAITHPAIDTLIAHRIAHAPPNSIVVLDMAVLVESRLGDGQYHVVVVIESDPEPRLDRLEARGMARDDARARMASQASDAERRAVADEVVINNGSLDELASAVDDLWDRLRRHERSSTSRH